METKKELMKKTKLELINLIFGGRSARSIMRNTIDNKEYQVKNFRMRLLKIRNEMDYLLVHPYSKDNTTYSKKHSRDGIRVSQYKGIKIIKGDKKWKR